MEHSATAGWLANHVALGAGFWTGAFGVFRKTITGAWGYPSLFVYLASRWSWPALLGMPVAGMITVGVVPAPGTAYRLQP